MAKLILCVLAGSVPALYFIISYKGNINKNSRYAALFFIVITLECFGSLIKANWSYATDYLPQKSQYTTAYVRIHHIENPLANHAGPKKCTIEVPCNTNIPTEISGGRFYVSCTENEGDYIEVAYKINEDNSISLTRTIPVIPTGSVIVITLYVWIIYIWMAVI